LTLGEHRLKVSGNRVLRISEEGCNNRRLKNMHNEELHNLYSSPNINRKMKSRSIGWTGLVACMGEEECIYGFGGKARRKRPLGRLRHNWEDNIKMDIRETGYSDMDWINLAHGRDQWLALVNIMMTVHKLL
jgi:hypothetical protein